VPPFLEEVFNFFVWKNKRKVFMLFVYSVLSFTSVILLGILLSLAVAFFISAVAKRKAVVTVAG
jgi:hypothetical protein